jgi:hypothetical protein
LLAYLDGGRCHGARRPRLILATCVHVLALVQDARAAEVLDAAHDEFMAIVSRLADAALRQGFLGHIPEHREIRAAWAAARALRANPPGT